MEERRIGTRERELAMGALDEHRRDGRLSTAEYTARSATAAAARLRSELDALFDDLPEPHPVYPGDRRPASADPAGRGPDPTAGTAPAAPSTRREDDLPELVLPTGAALARHVGTLSVFTPVIAFGLFALTGFRFPVIFLLVPVALGVLGWLAHRHGG